MQSLLLIKEHGPTQEDLIAWAKEEARIENLWYKKEQEVKAIQIMFHVDRSLNYETYSFS